jgi:hypothetical protein
MGGEPFDFNSAASFVYFIIRQSAAICCGVFPDWGCGGYEPEENHRQTTAAYVALWLEELERESPR